MWAQKDQRTPDDEEVVAVDELAQGHQDRGVALRRRERTLVERGEGGG